jgi:tRNA/tmRNA/rRNA uracil-C5-methylase (TrmA/RlmC/RlmD family)
MPLDSARPEGCVERCPACPQRGFSQEESESRINHWLGSELSSWREHLRPIRSPGALWGYRRKALLHARLVDGAWRLGMIRMRGREEEFIPIPQCPLHAPGLNQRLNSAIALIPPEIPLAFVLVSGGALTLVVKAGRQAEWADRLKEIGAGEEEALWVNWNPGAGKRAVDSRYLELLGGTEWLRDRGLFHGPTAFRQQIPEMEEAALGAAEEFLAGAGIPTVADFYSGLGASLARWRARGWEALGIELSGESVSAAERNGVEVLRGRVEDRLPQMKEFLRGRPFVVYTNPPRSGHGEEVLRWLKEEAPKRIAYLSCHPRSLSGDLKSLGERYRVKALQPFNFFPQTGHAETLAFLEIK